MLASEKPGALHQSFLYTEKIHIATKKVETIWFIRLKNIRKAKSTSNRSSHHGVYASNRLK